MRGVAQRCLQADVSVEGECVGRIERGLVLFIGAGEDDTETDAVALAEKSLGLRIFPDELGKMSRNVLEAGGGILAISQFTLFGDVRRGLRPSFDKAMAPGPAEVLYERAVAELRKQCPNVATGRFRKDMKITVVNDGPVTILIDSKKTF